MRGLWPTFGCHGWPRGGGGPSIWDKDEVGSGVGKKAYRRANECLLELSLDE
jgi:hypothetical protein